MQKSAKTSLQKSAKGRKRAQRRKNNKQPGLKQPGLGTPKRSLQISLRASLQCFKSVPTKIFKTQNFLKISKPLYPSCGSPTTCSLAAALQLAPNQVCVPGRNYVRAPPSPQFQGGGGILKPPSGRIFIPPPFTYIPQPVDGRNRAIVIAEPLARAIAAI